MATNSLGEEHVAYRRLDFPILKLSVVGGRPFSHGGKRIFRKGLLSERLVVQYSIFLLNLSNLFSSFFVNSVALFPIDLENKLPYIDPIVNFLWSKFNNTSCLQIVAFFSILFFSWHQWCSLLVILVILTLFATFHIGIQIWS